MVSFTNNKILAESGKTVAEQLQTARADQGIPLKKASKKTKIKIQYLKALESGDYHKLPGGIYEKKYLQDYAVFLGLDPHKLIKDSQKEKEVVMPSGQERVSFFSKNKLKNIDFVIFPRIIKNFLIIAVVAVCFSYLGFCLQGFMSPPQLNLIKPQDDLVTTKNHISVTGEVGAGTEVFINGNSILTNDSGKFKKDITLKKGVNTITVTAQKKYSKAKTLKKQVLAK